MANQSFRDILSEFLEENDSPTPPKPSAPRMTIAQETPSFHWENTSTVFTKPSFGYARTEAKTAAATGEVAAAEVKTTPPIAKPIVQEPKWFVSELNSADQRQVQALVNLGGSEVAKEISVSTLKKVYRRLAKQLHPDTALAMTGKQKSQEDFLALQSIYEGLSESLAALTTKFSARENGNESASAPKSQRRDAA